MLKHLLASVAVCALSTATMAADLPARKNAAAPVVATPASWTGFYVGGQLGWAASRLSVSGENNDVTLFNGSQTLNSYLAGGFAGYDHQIGSIVLGVEADANARMGHKTTSGTFAWAGTNETWKSQSAWDASLRLRMGILATNQTLIYATGGVAWLNYKFSMSDTGGTLSENKIHTGWTIGGGLQQALTKNISLRAEYRYSDYGSKSGSYQNAYDNGKGVQTQIDPYKDKLRDNRATVGLAYKF